MFCIGKIDVFYESAGYGFITPIQSLQYLGDIYFRKKDILAGSSLCNNLNYSSLVAFYLVGDPQKPDRQKATWIVLVKEMEPHILRNLIENYKLEGEEIKNMLE